MTPKRLERVDDGALIAGVVAGFAKYFELDIVFCRVIAIAILIFSGVVPGLLVYIIAAFIIPKEQPHQTPPEASTKATDYTVVE